MSPPPRDIQYQTRENIRYAPDVILLEAWRNVLIAQAEGRDPLPAFSGWFSALLGLGDHDDTLHQDLDEVDAYVDGLLAKRGYIENRQYVALYTPCLVSFMQRQGILRNRRNGHMGLATDDRLRHHHNPGGDEHAS